MKFLFRAIFVFCLAAGLPVHAQWGAIGGLLGGGGGGGDVDAVLTSGTKIIVFTTIATDLAVSSALQMLEAFPPEQVEAIKNTFVKYNELKAKRGAEGQLDSDSATLASDGFKEMEKLKVADYQKGKSQVVRSAYTKMGLAMAADALAATQLPTFVKSGSSAISSLASNPLQITKLGRLKVVVATVTVLAKAVPSQINSIKTVREMAKKIAEAEGVQLGEAKLSLTSLDPEALNQQIKSKEEEG